MRHIIQHDTDLSGAPELPKHLSVAFARMMVTDLTLNPNGNAQIEEEAKKVYEIWKANGFRRVAIDPEVHEQRRSEFCTSDNADFFIQVYPECFCKNADIRDGLCTHEDFDSELELKKAVATYELEVSQASDWCFSCPLKDICLASSLTNEQVNRSNRVHIGAPEFEYFGIWGGYGTRSRALILDKMVELFESEYGEVPEEYFPHIKSDGGFFGYDRDEYNTKLPEPTGLIRTRPRAQQEMKKAS